MFVYFPKELRKIGKCFELDGSIWNWSWTLLLVLTVRTHWGQTNPMKHNSR